MFTWKAHLLAALALAMALPALDAPAAQCSSVCTETTLCSRFCRDGTEPMTCGEYGICNYGGGGCSPNFKVISSTVNGVFPYSYGTLCDEIAAYQNLWHDVNNCPGSSDYTTCSYYTIHTHSWSQGGCCLDVTCGGSGPCMP